MMNYYLRSSSSSSSSDSGSSSSSSSTIDSNNYLTFKALEDGSTIKLVKVGNPNVINLRYSYNQGLNWTDVIWEDDVFTWN